MGYALTAGFFTAITVYTALLLILVKANGTKLRLRQRLEKLSAEETEAPKQPRQRRELIGSGLPAVFRPGTLSKIGAELSLAGVSLRAEEFLLIWMFTGLFFPALFYLGAKNLIAAAGLAVFGLAVPPALVSRCKKKRMALFEAQLLDALVVISNCLRAGFTFQQALGNIAAEMPEPISKEFGKTVREIRLGIPMDTALQDMVARLHNDDLDLLVSAVLIQKQVGGNLADILDSIAGTVGERLKLKGEIKVLTASGKISGLIIGLLPVLLLAFLMVANPSYVSLFFTNPAGIAMLVYAAIMECIGFVIIRKIVNIKF